MATTEDGDLNVLSLAQILWVRNLYPKKAVFAYYSVRKGRFVVAAGLHISEDAVIPSDDLEDPDRISIKLVELELFDMLLQAKQLRKQFSKGAIKK